MRRAVVVALAAAALTPKEAMAHTLSPPTVTVENSPAVTLAGTAESTTAPMSTFSVTDSAPGRGGT